MSINHITLLHLLLLVTPGVPSTEPCMKDPLGAAFAHARLPLRDFTPRLEGLSTVYLIFP